MTDALLQVFLIIGIGVLVAWLGWIDEQATQIFSGLITRVFLPALLFRAMAPYSPPSSFSLSLRAYLYLR